MLNGLAWKRIFVLTAFVLLFGVPKPALAADKEVEDLLSHMRDAYKAVQAATFTVTATIQDTDSDQKPIELKPTSEFAFKKPNLVRAFIKGIAGTQTITVIGNGKTINVNVPGTGSLPEEEFTDENYAKYVPSNLETLCFWEWEKQLSTTAGNNMEHSTFNIVKDEVWNDKHWIVLEETAAKNNDFVRYFIDPKTYLIWRTNAKNLDTKKDREDFKVTKMDTNAKLDDSMFTGS